MAKKEISIEHGKHKWEKQNLVTVSSRKGNYDIMKCANCELVGHKFTFTTLVIQGGSQKKIDYCNRGANIPARIRITRCRAVGELFANLLPGSEHDTVNPPCNYKNDSSGVWVMGVGEPVKVLNDEYILPTS